MDFRDRRVWSVIGAIVILIILAWMFGWIGGGAPAR